MDHSQVHSFWCFSFERDSGIMGSISTKKRSLELKLMRKVILCRFLDSVQLPTQYNTEFEGLMSTCAITLHQIRPLVIPFYQLPAL